MKPAVKEYEELPCDLFGQMRMAIALWVWPQFKSKAISLELITEAYRQVDATRYSLQSYKELLTESERQRQIDIDARHALAGEAATWRLKFEQVISNAKLNTHRD